MLETNRLRMSIENISNNYQQDVEDVSTLYEHSLNEYNESYSRISFFYQFLLKDCLYPELELSWVDLKQISYFYLHRELYLLFKENVYNSTSDSDSGSLSTKGSRKILVTFPSSITISTRLGCKC